MGNSEWLVEPSLAPDRRPRIHVDNAEPVLAKAKEAEMLENDNNFKQKPVSTTDCLPTPEPERTCRRMRRMDS